MTKNVTARTTQASDDKSCVWTVKSEMSVRDSSKASKPIFKIERACTSFLFYLHVNVHVH